MILVQPFSLSKVCRVHRSNEYKFEGWAEVGFQPTPNRENEGILFCLICPSCLLQTTWRRGSESVYEEAEFELKIPMFTG